MRGLIRFLRSGSNKESRRQNAASPPQASFIGHRNILQRLIPLADNSLAAQTPLPHLLFTGPYGSGRKTLALWLAAKTGRSLHLREGTELSAITDLILWLAEINDSDFLLIENLAKIPLPVAKALAAILKSFSFVFPHPETKEPQNWPTPCFTLIGLVIEIEALPHELKECFSHSFKLEPYSLSVTTQIIHHWGRIPFPAAKRLAELTGNRLPLARGIYQSFFEAKLDPDPDISPENVDKAVAQLELDENLLTQEERALLSFLIGKDKPVPKENLLPSLNLTAFSSDKKMKHLVASGLINENPEGIKATLKARLMLNKLKPYDQAVNQLKNPALTDKATQYLLGQREKSAPYLVSFLSDPDPLIRNSVYRLIPHAGEKTFPGLMQLLISENTPLWEKENILQILSQNPSPAALNALQKVARSRNLPLKLAALKSIGFQGRKKTIPFLVRLVKKEKEPVQIAAVEALQRLNTLEIIAPLKQIINTVPFNVQKAILKALRLVGDASVVGLIDKEKVVSQHGKR